MTLAENGLEARFNERDKLERILTREYTVTDDTYEVVLVEGELVVRRNGEEVARTLFSEAVETLQENHGHTTLKTLLERVEELDGTQTRDLSDAGTSFDARAYVPDEHVETVRSMMEEHDLEYANEEPSKSRYRSDTYFSWTEA